MLHLENFFEKSFALLLTTPKRGRCKKNHLQFALSCAIVMNHKKRIEGDSIPTILTGRGRHRLRAPS